MGCLSSKEINNDDIIHSENEENSFFYNHFGVANFSNMLHEEVHSHTHSEEESEAVIDEVGAIEEENEEESEQESQQGSEQESQQNSGEESEEEEEMLHRACLKREKGA